MDEGQQNSSNDDTEEVEENVGDIVSIINYNTITSMAALREILGGHGYDGIDAENTSWFQHYFLHHCNRLPSRHKYTGRRLSECKEEDENQELDDSEHSEISHMPQLAECESIEGAGSSSPTVTSSLVSSPPSTSSTHSSPKNVMNLQIPHPLHVDKNFFESGLIKMKSFSTTSCTLQSTDDIWIRRDDYEEEKDSATDRTQPLPEEPENRKKSNESDRSRKAEIWSQVESPGRQSVDSASSQCSSRSHSGQRTPPTSKSGASSSKSKNRTSQSPSRISNFFDAFRPRSKSDAAKAHKKSGTFISQMKMAVQNSLSPGSSSRNNESSTSTDDHAHKNRNAQVNDTYAHTVGYGARYRVESNPRARTNSESTTSSRGAVSKMMDLFRNRSNSAVTSEDKRKVKVGYQQQTSSNHGALLRRTSLDPDRRRLSLGVSAVHRSSDVGLDPTHAAILFRDSRGLPVANPFLEKVSLSDLEEDESQIFVKFFKFHKCYDLIPTSAKLVVFDTQLLVKKAFFALVDNGVRAAPLWDSSKQKFVGMLTITDFIKILQKYYTKSPSTTDELEEQKLETWRDVLMGENHDMISIGPDVSLYEAIKTLINNKIHRLPVIDPNTGNVLYILTHKRILKFLYLYINDLPKPSYMNRTLKDLKIGTYENVETVVEDTTLILAFEKFVERRVSALPMVDSEGKLVDIFAKFDVINLAAERTYDNLDVTLKKANEHRNEWFEGVHRCHMGDTLHVVLEKIVRAEVHRLVVVDEDERVIGILSLSDLLVFLVLRPSSDFKSHQYVSPTKEHRSLGDMCAGVSSESKLDDVPEDREIDVFYSETDSCAGSASLGASSQTQIPVSSD